MELLRGGYSTTASLPVQITRHSDQHNQSAPERFSWPLDDGVERPGSANQNVDRREPRVSGTTIWAGSVGAFPAEDEQADHGESGCAPLGMNDGHASEEEAVLGHGEADARSRQSTGRSRAEARNRDHS